MPHFAKVENGVVTTVIVADQSFIDSGAVGDPTTWVQTSYNGSTRKSYAGIGYLYISEIDAFVPPKPFESWVLEEKSGRWVAPVPRPDNDTIWDEETLSWKKTENILPDRGN